MSADPVAATRQILLNDSAVTALIGGATPRIFGEIDEDQAKVMPEACIVLKPSGGPRSPGGGFQHYGKQRVDVISYGASLYESYLVNLAAYDALKAAKRQISEGVLIHSIEAQSKGSTARDPEKQWPVTYSSYLVMYAETPVS